MLASYNPLGTSSPSRLLVVRIRTIMFMTKAELDSIAEGWIRYQLATEGSTQQKADWGYVSTAFEIRKGDPQLLWQLILAIHSRNQSDDVQCVLAAGPLEDLLANHGSEFIEVVEQRAKDDPSFARLLRGVYRSSMSDDVWRRVTNIANESRKAELQPKARRRKAC